jgi:hypothetical protein
MLVIVYSISDNRLYKHISLEHTLQGAVVYQLKKNTIDKGIVNIGNLFNDKEV